MRRLEQARAWRVEVFLALFFVVTNLGWIAKDTRPWPVIDCYMAANNVMAAMGRDPSVQVDSTGAFLSTISQGGRPPLYQLCTVPFVALLGFSEDAFLAVNLALLVLLFAATHRLGVELHGRFAGLVSAVVVVSFPPIVHLLRQYRAYSGAIACIALTLWALMVLINRRRIKAAWGAALAATAAILMHPISAYVLLVPMASTWLWMFFSSGKPGEPERPLALVEYLRGRFRAPLFLKGLLPAASLPAIFTLGWYLTCGQSGFKYFSVLKSGWITSFRGASKIAAGFMSVPADWKWLALTSPHTISLVLAVLSVAFSIWLLVRGDAKARLLVLWLIAAYFGVGVYLRVLNWQYGAFALPLVAAVLGLGVASLPGRKARLLAGGLVLVFSAMSFSLVTWGIPDLPNTVNRALGLWYDHCQLELCRDAPVVQHYPHTDLLASIVREEGPGGNERTSLFPMSPGLSSEAYRFVLLRYRAGVRVRVFRHGSQNWGTPFPFEALLRSKWLIVRTELRQWYWGNKQPNFYLRGLARLFRHPPRLFQESYVEVKRSPWPGEGDLVLFRRVRPASVNEIDAVVGALDLEPRFLTTSALMAADVLEKAGRRDEALRRLDRAAKIEDQPPRARASLLARSAFLLLRGGRIAQAERKAKEAARVDPRAVEVRKVLHRLKQRRMK